MREKSARKNLKTSNRYDKWFVMINDKWFQFNPNRRASAARNFVLWKWFLVYFDTTFDSRDIVP